MNDLNSVFMVGKIVESPHKVVSGAELDLVNNHYAFDEVKKEYVESKDVFRVTVAGRQADKWLTTLKKGQRIGVNGRLVHKAKKVEILAYSVQVLEPVVKSEQKSKTPKKVKEKTA